LALSAKITGRHPNTPSGSKSHIMVVGLKVKGKGWDREPSAPSPTSRSGRVRQGHDVPVHARHSQKISGPSASTTTRCTPPHRNAHITAMVAVAGIARVSMGMYDDVPPYWPLRETPPLISLAKPLGCLEILFHLT
jgi:hypothetical protein